MASVGVWVDAGSRFELPGTNGTAHFLEHMAFKGTERRPTANALEVEIEDMGARLNAYTSREQTTFFADVQGRDVPAALDVLSDILQHPRFPQQGIQRERGVILREMEEVQGMMEEVIFDHLHTAAFRDHPLGDTILGPTENIKSISKKDLQQYISTHYTCPRMVVSASGAVDHDEVVDQVRKLFTGFSTDPTTADQLVEANPAIFTGSEVRVEHAEMPLAHIAIAFKGSSWTDPSSIPLMVTQSILGSWNRSIGVGNCSGSALARGISNGELAENLMAFNTNYRDTGLFGIYTGAPPDALHDLSRLIMEEFRRLAFRVSETEVARARNQDHASLWAAVSENNGRQMLTYGRVMPFLELFARIDAVDCDTVMKTAKEFIIDKANDGSPSYDEYGNKDHDEFIYKEFADFSDSDNENAEMMIIEEELEKQEEHVLNFKGSIKGKRAISWDRIARAKLLYKDYFKPDPTYDEGFFQRHFRMS
uniref:Putative mitochondrial-processing peptidase subunit beta n=1 Tax=Aegilops tauschii TaxID=37682 RepID=M8CJU9_AEGTA